MIFKRLEPAMLFILTTIVVVECVKEQPVRTMILSQILFRHGDRSPMQIFPSDINRHLWTDGMGQLTNIGKQQQYELGKFLRTRYMGGDTPLLNSTYTHYEIEVRSTDVKRTLESAESNLAGLYPPLTAGEKWSNDIAWQPIPVHTRPRGEDIALNDDIKCPRATELYFQSMNSKEIRDLSKNNQEFFKFIKSNSKMPMVNLSTIWSLGDTLLCEKAHNMPDQPWMKKSWGGIPVYSHIRKLVDVQFDLLFDRIPELIRLRGGPLLKDMIDHMKYTVANPEDSKRVKLYMYSAHDTTVGPLLSALSVFNKLFPNYASCVFVELFKDEHKLSGTVTYSVRLSYRNQTRPEPFVLIHPGCEEYCELNKFIHLSKPLIPVNYAEECMGTTPKDIIKQNIVLGLSICLGVVTVCLLCTVLAHLRSYRARLRYARYRNLSNTDNECLVD